MKKHFAFSDSHGNYDAVKSSLERVGFDINNKDHHIIFLGDGFDRGNQNIEILSFLHQMHLENRLVWILGNHDDFLLKYLEGEDNGEFNLLHNGMNLTLENFHGDCQSIVIYTADKYYPYAINQESEFKKDPVAFRTRIINNVPVLRELLKSTVDHYRLGKYLFTHAGYSKDHATGNWVINNWANTKTFLKSFGDTKHYDPETIYVVGHWHARDLRSTFERNTRPADDSIFIYKNYIALDACTVHSNFVNVLVIDN